MCFDVFIYLIYRSVIFFDVAGLRLWYNLNRKYILQMISNGIKFPRETLCIDANEFSVQRLIIIIELNGISYVGDF